MKIIYNLSKKKSRASKKYLSQSIIICNIVIKIDEGYREYACTYILVQYTNKVIILFKICTYANRIYKLTEIAEIYKTYTLS